MDDIKKIAENLWLVHGKVIGSMRDDVFDDSTPDGRSAMIDVVDNTCEGPLFPRHGMPPYVSYFQRAHPSTGRRFFLFSQLHFLELPEEIRDILRKELPQYASEF